MSTVLIGQGKPSYLHYAHSLILTAVVLVAREKGYPSYQTCVLPIPRLTRGRHRTLSKALAQ